MGAWDDAKRCVLEQSQWLARAGYLIATGGNVSVRTADGAGLAITPSGRDYLTMQPDDVCVVGWDGQTIEGELRPSVETGMHAAVYRAREDVAAIVHTHQPHASVLAVLNLPIPALFDEQVMGLGLVVDVVPYAVSGSAELHEHVAAAVANQCNAYLLQNHGALCLGTTMDEAVRNVQVLEKCAHVYAAALATGREITTLPAAMAEAIFELHRSEQRAAIRRNRRAARAATT